LNCLAGVEVWKPPKTISICHRRQFALVKRRWSRMNRPSASSRTRSGERIPLGAWFVFEVQFDLSESVGGTSASFDSIIKVVLKV
jgi:hypothetical protein